MYSFYIFEVIVLVRYSYPGTKNKEYEKYSQ